MSSFLLRILFTGLMAFVPSEDGKELTVLLLNGNHQHLSDGTMLEQHKPLLLARAGSCSGDCPTRDSNIAQAVYPDLGTTARLDALESAVSGGGAWQLSGSDLSLRKVGASAADLPELVIRSGARATVNGQPDAIPATSAEREDFSWVANLDRICPTCGNVSSGVLATPPSAVVAARLRLRSGNVFTYSVAKIGSNVTPVHFERLDGQGSVSPYSQAIATWVGADVTVTGDAIEIVDAKFDGTPGRSMTLAPDANGKVEVAVLNVPSFIPPATTSNAPPEVGKHFEVYYDTASNAPAMAERLVPKAGAAASVGSYPQVTWQSIHPQSVLWSDLLNQLRMNPGRTIYERILCPPTQNPQP